MGEEYKNQHIVSQAYLNRFGIKKKDHYIIGTRLKPTAEQKPKLFTTSVDKVGYIVKYYDVCKRDDPKYWEHFLDEKFDTLCGKPLDKIITKITLSAHNKKVLDSEDKALLSRVIMSQMLRVPSFLDDYIDRSVGILDSYKQEILQNLPQTFEPQRQLIEQISFDIDDRKDMILNAVFDKENFQRYCSALKKKAWFVIYNTIRHEMPFVTSDNPVVIADIKGGAGTITSIGLENDQAVILYPLTPKILVGIYSTDLIMSVSEELDGKCYPINELKFIKNVNYLTIRQCYRHAFLPEPLFSSLPKNN